MVKLEKNRIYKVITANSRYSRNYMIFALPKDMLWNDDGKSVCIKSLFLIDLEGGFSFNSDMGLRARDAIVELKASDWFEVGGLLRGTKFRVNLRTKKVTDIELENWEITEI